MTDPTQPASATPATPVNDVPSEFVSLPPTTNTSTTPAPVAKPVRGPFRITTLETKALKTVVGFVGIALSLTSGLTLPHPWDIIVSIILGAGTTAGIWKAPNKVVSGEIQTAAGTAKLLPPVE